MTVTEWCLVWRHLFHHRRLEADEGLELERLTGHLPAPPPSCPRRSRPTRHSPVNRTPGVAVGVGDGLKAAWCSRTPSTVTHSRRLLMLLFVRVSQAGDAAEAVTAAAVPPPGDEDGCHEGRSRAMRALTHVVALSRSGPPGGGADGLRQVCWWSGMRVRDVGQSATRIRALGGWAPRCAVWKPADIVVRIPFAPRGLAVGAQPSDGAQVGRAAYSWSVGRSPRRVRTGGGASSGSTRR